MMPRPRGFTLIEIAVVVALIGIMLTAGLKLAGALLENAAYSVTQKKEAAIKDALIAYVAAYKRLPCPDTGPVGFNGALAPGNVPDGRENRKAQNPAGSPFPDVTTDCASPFGVLPYLDLGLPRETALDGWQSYFSYQVSTLPGGGGNTNLWNKTGNPPYPEANLAPAPSPPTSNTAPPPGYLMIKPDSTAASAPISNSAVAVVISYGSDGSGAYTVNGTQNAPPAAGNVDEIANIYGAGGAISATNAVYVVRQPTDNPNFPTGAFDDVVLYLGASDLVYPLYQSNVLVTPASGVSQQLSTVRNAILAYAVQNFVFRTCSTTLPTALTAASTWLPVGAGFPAQDPWRNAWVFPYTIAPYPAETVTIASNTAPGPVAVAYGSAGPDGVLGTADDIVAAVYVSDVQAALVQAFTNPGNPNCVVGGGGGGGGRGGG